MTWNEHFINFQSNLIVVFDRTEQICPVCIDSAERDFNKPFLKEPHYVIGPFTNNHPR